VRRRLAWFSRTSRPPAERRSAGSRWGGSYRAVLRPARDGTSGRPTARHAAVMPGTSPARRPARATCGGVARAAGGRPAPTIAARDDGLRPSSRLRTADRARRAARRSPPPPCALRCPRIPGSRPRDARRDGDRAPGGRRVRGAGRRGARSPHPGGAAIHGVAAAGGAVSDPVRRARPRPYLTGPLRAAFDAWLADTVARHSRELEFREIRKGLQALST